MDTKPPKPIRTRPYIPVHNPELAIYIDKHMPTAAQVKWLEECGGRLMRPSDAREIMEILERER